MKNTYRSVSLIMLLVVVLLFTTISAAASEIIPLNAPVISRPYCSSCNLDMTYIGEDVDITSVQVDVCENALEAITPHWHDYKYYYDAYHCLNCSNNGKIYVKTTMRCQISMNEFRIENPGSSFNGEMR